MKDITKIIEEGAKSAVDGVITAGKLAAAGVAWMVDEAVALGKSAKDAVSGWMSEEEKEAAGNSADPDSTTRANEKQDSYRNGKKVIDIENFSQKELDKRLGNKGNCKFTDYMILAEARMRAEGQNTEDFYSNEIYDDAKKEGDKIIEGKSNILDPDKLLRKAGVKGDILWGREIDPSKFNSTLIEQLDKGNPVMIVLNDNHGEIIYGYEKSGDSLRYLIHDVGYQEDTYLNSKNWQPYKDDYNYSTQKGIPKIVGGKPRSVTKLLYLR